MAAGNKSLGRFILDGIPPSPRGIPQIEVTFDIDANGILSVTAKDKATGRTQSIRIEASSGLSKEEIERMKKDAELHAEEDKKNKELIEARNMADTLAYTTEKAMREAGDKITDEEKKPVQEKIDELNKVKNGDDLEAIKKATEALSQEAQKIGQKLYAAAQEAQKAQQTSQGEQPQAGGAEQPGTEEKPKEAETEKK
jgi:molecular chaperone DnaK